MKRKNILLVIDPQRDFCEGGKLAVKGGNAALTRVGRMLSNRRDFFDDVIITFDQHHAIHIAHPVWFVSADGKDVPPFTVIDEYQGELYAFREDANGVQHRHEKVVCRIPSLTKWTMDYILSLRNNKRYQHRLWPPHCLIGTEGACLHPEMEKGMFDWESGRFAIANKITKGSNYRTEHFGAVHAEVEDPSDPSTQTKEDFLALLENDDVNVYVCGLALGHCLANTVRDAAAKLGGAQFMSRVTLLTDGTASVENLEFLGDEFVTWATGLGMKLTLTTDL